MFANGVLASNSSELIVVGGGIAGLTAAAAGLTGGANVTLIEKEGYLSQYEGALHRELHPNLLAWPFQNLRSVTGLPFLNWSCTKAPTVTQQVLDQWNEDFAPLVRPIKDNVTRVDENDAGVQVECAGAGLIPADAVVVTVGFDREAKLTDIPSPSYWTFQEFEPPGDVSISGSGDGGLIECASQVFGHKAVAAARALTYALNDQLRKQQVLDAEIVALEHFSNGRRIDAFASLDLFYRKFTLAQREMDLLESFRRKRPLKAILYHRDEGVFSPMAAPANKLIASMLMKSPSVNLESIQCDEVCSTSGIPQASVDGVIKPLDPFRIVVRHGARPAALSLLTDLQIRTLSCVSREHLNEVVPDDFDQDFYVNHAAQAIAPSSNRNVEHLAERVYRWVHQLIENACDSVWDCQFVRVQGEAWKIHASSKVAALLKPLFPIRIESIEVKLEDRPAAIFAVQR